MEEAKSFLVDPSTCRTTAAVTRGLSPRHSLDGAL